MSPLCHHRKVYTVLHIFTSWPLKTLLHMLLHFSYEHFVNLVQTTSKTVKKNSKFQSLEMYSVQCLFVQNMNCIHHEPRQMPVYLHIYLCIELKLKLTGKRNQLITLIREKNTIKPFFK